MTSGGSDWLAGSGRAEKVDGRLPDHRSQGLRERLAGGRPVHDDGHPRRSRRGGPTVLHFAIPFDAPASRSTTTGTRSACAAPAPTTSTLDGVFVPDAAIGVRRPAGRWGPAWHVVASIALPLIYSVYVGVAEGRPGPRAARGGRPPRTTPASRSWSARMENELAAARMALRQMIDAAGGRARGDRDDQRGDDRPGGGRPGGDPDRRGRDGGGRRAPASTADLGLERLFRDVQGARYHPLRGSAQRRYAGRAGPRSGRERVGLHRRRSKGADDMKTIRGLVSAGIGLLAVVILAGAPGAHADVVTDANAKAADIVSRIPAPPITVRMMAIVQVSVFEAVNAITGRYPRAAREDRRRRRAPRWMRRSRRRRAPRCSKLMPAQQAAIDADYQALLRLGSRRPREDRGHRGRRAGGGRHRGARAPTTGRSPPTRIAPTPRPASTCRRRGRRCPTGASAGPG